MIFSHKKEADARDGEPASSLFRVVQQLLLGFSLHAVEFDTDEHVEFRQSIREIAEKFEALPDHKDLLILAGEANKTIQTYNHLVEKFIRDLSGEKQLAVEMLARSLLRVCHASEKTAGALRQIEKDLAKASQLQDIRELRLKMGHCIQALCEEAEAQEMQYEDLKQRVSDSSSLLEPSDPLTGLSTLKAAEAKIKDFAAAGRQGFVLVFFVKNVDVVNRRYGFDAGDAVLKKFAAHLRNSFKANEHLFRWRGPCFVVVAERFSPIESVQAEAYKLGARGPEADVEGNGRSLLVRLTAATQVLPITKGLASGELSLKIDHFAAEQFKISPVPSLA